MSTNKIVFWASFTFLLMPNVSAQAQGADVDGARLALKAEKINTLWQEGKDRRALYVQGQSGGDLSRALGLDLIQKEEDKSALGKNNSSLNSIVQRDLALQEKLNRPVPPSTSEQKAPVIQTWNYVLNAPEPSNSIERRWSGFRERTGKDERNRYR